MDEEKFDLLIIFRNGTRKVIKNVDGYGILNSSATYYYSKNGLRGFMPIDAITFVGRNIDYLS